MIFNQFFKFWQFWPNLELLKLLLLIPEERLTLKVFPGRRDVGHDVGDDAEDGCERDQADDQLEYHIQVFGPGNNSMEIVNYKN